MNNQGIFTCKTLVEQSSSQERFNSMDEDILKGSEPVTETEQMSKISSDHSLFF